MKAVLLSSLLLPSLAFSPEPKKTSCFVGDEDSSIRRRLLLTSSAALLSSCWVYPAVGAAPLAPRINEIGGGFDVISPPSNALQAEDVIYPPSMLGPWQCQRVVKLVEGDKDQALVSWKALGGTNEDVFTKQKVETYRTQYIKSPIMKEEGVVLDRGFEIASRAERADVQWDPTIPGVLSYPTTGGQVQLAIVQRKVEPPSDQGFGFNELVRMTTPAGGIVALGDVQRATRIKRRYRRAFDEAGNRVVEGLEIMTTYRVLDGVAGIEMPISTTKSQLRMTRPPSS